MEGADSPFHMDILHHDNGNRRDRQRSIQWYASTSLAPVYDWRISDIELVPFRFRGLYAIGVIFVLLNIVLFIINIVMISLRFYIHPETFKASILHPTERLFLPASVVSFGTILLNISQYGPGHVPGHWLNDAVAILFWLDVALAIIASTTVYLVMLVSKNRSRRI